MHVYKNADGEDKNDGTLSSDFPLHFLITVLQKFLKFLTSAIIQIILFPCVVFPYESKKNSKMEMVLVMSISPLFLVCVRIMEFKYYCFGLSYDTSLYENKRFKLYDSTLPECTHLIVKLHLEDTTRIAILLGKMQNLVTS